MTALDKITAEKLLSDHDLRAFLPLNLVARRSGCSVWSAQLFTPYGDAEAEIQIDPLQSDPITFVDMEEEAAALERSSLRSLVRQLQDDEYGILVTCAREHEAIFNRFFAPDAPDERSINYHLQLNRILGGDYFHQVNERWLKGCLAPKSRALEIKDLLDRVETSYKASPPWEGKLEQPLPKILAVFSIPAIELPGAPLAYQDLALIQFVINSPAPVQVKPPHGCEQLLAFCRQLFGLIETAHLSGGRVQP